MRVSENGVYSHWNSHLKTGFHDQQNHWLQWGFPYIFRQTQVIALFFWLLGAGPLASSASHHSPDSRHGLAHWSWWQWCSGRTAGAKFSPSRFADLPQMVNHPMGLWIGSKSHGHWIGLREHLQEPPIFHGKNHGFRLRFSLKPIHWVNHHFHYFLHYKKRPFGDTKNGHLGVQNP